MTNSKTPQFSLEMVEKVARAIELRFRVAETADARMVARIALEASGHAQLADEIERLRAALKLAAEQFNAIQTLNSHGAPDATYIGWLRSCAKQGEEQARAALSGQS